MHLDPLLLSRFQWAWVIGWHILLPAFTVGCASYIAVLEGLAYWREDPSWIRISQFWIRIFAVAFGMGVVTGIVMPFQFGTNWSRFSDATANVLSPMLAYEDLMAFFLEASFLGVLLFGRNRVPRWAHLLSACMVALGTLMSSFWILAANSWMQTPTGAVLRDGRFFPVDWFAIVFAIIIPAVYFPVLLMLLALVFRGVAFEFRFRQSWLAQFWSHGFCVGSAIAAFAQGAVIGSFIQGFNVEDRVFAGSSWDWLTPFSVFTGFALMAGYGLLGAGWLIIKTEGALQDWARRMGRVCLAGVVVAILAVSVWTPLADASIAQRWFSWPGILLLTPVPTATAVLVYAAWRALNGSGGDATTFVVSIGLFLMSYLGIAISLWPMVVPHHFSLWQAASSPSTQAFLLIGTLVLVPVILMYTAWSYWVFRGKIRDDIGYH